MLVVDTVVGVVAEVLAMMLSEMVIVPVMESDVSGGGGDTDSRLGAGGDVLDTSNVNDDVRDGDGGSGVDDEGVMFI